MELMIIQYSFWVVLGIYLISIPLRIILAIHDIPKTLGLTTNKRWKNIL